MADGNVVGSAEFELRATKRKLGDDIKGAENDLKASMGRVEQDAEKSSKSIGSSMGRMTRGIALGFTALAATLAAGLAIALKFGQASLKMADDLADSARRIGISTTALQEWQHVARRTGQDANAVGGALESFGVKLAQAGAGLSKEAADTFRALGFSPEQLRSFKDVESALDAVTDRIGELDSASDRAAIAEKLELGPLATALREGSDEVARLRDEASALGFVMDESLIQKGADAQAQLDDLSRVIGIQMAGAFINLSDEVLAFTGHIAEAIRKLNEFADRYEEAKQRNIDEKQNSSWINNFGRALGGDFTENLPWVRARNKPGSHADSMANARANPAYEDPDDPAFLWGMSASERRRRFGQNLPSGRTSLTPVQPKGRTDNSAQRAAEREARRAERVEQEIFRARQRVLGIADKEVMTVQERYDLAKKQVEMEREAETKELASRKARGDITQAEFDQFKLIQTQTATLEDRVSADILARDLADERLAKERALTDLTADLLSLQSSAARSAAERRDIERRLLAMAQQRAREDMEKDVRFQQDSPAEQQAQRDALKQVQAAQSAAVERQNMTPLERWRDESLKTTDEVREAYENVAARGLDALNDGIVDAIMNSRNLGEVFHNVAQQILADLLSISVRRSITEPLANMLFPQGGGTGGGSNVGSKVVGWLSKLLPRNAKGTASWMGGPSVVNEFGGEIMNLPNGTQIIPHDVSMRMAAGAGSRQQAAPMHFDMRGAVMTSDLLAQMEQMALNSGGMAFAGARQTVPTDMAKTNRYTRGR